MEWSGWAIGGKNIVDNTPATSDEWNTNVCANGLHRSGQDKNGVPTYYIGDYGWGCSWCCNGCIWLRSI